MIDRTWLAVKAVAVVIALPIFFWRFGGFPRQPQVALWLVTVAALGALSFYSLERAKEGLSDTWLNEHGKPWRRWGFVWSWDPGEYDPSSRRWFWVTWVFWAATLVDWFWGSEHFGGLPSS